MAKEAELLIRDPQPDDEAAWRRLWTGYNAFYQVDVPETVTALTWSRILDPSVPMFARIAEAEGAVVGFAISTLHPSTWTAELTCYLEDVFVDPDKRGLGTGRALIDDLLARARDRRWARVYWHTHADNTAARALYDSYTEADDFVRYRIPLNDYAQRGNNAPESIG